MLQSTSTLVIGIVLSLFYSWRVTLLSAVMVPVVFAGVFLEARFMLGHGLQEKTAIETAAKVQGDWYCQFINLLIVIIY
jgi:hypothetical protein